MALLAGSQQGALKLRFSLTVAVFCIQTNYGVSQKGPVFDTQQINSFLFGLKIAFVLDRLDPDRNFYILIWNLKIDRVTRARRRKCSYP